MTQTFLGFPIGTLHGLMSGKRRTPRLDCDECLVEAWERMTYGGLNLHTIIRWDGPRLSCLYGDMGATVATR